MNYLKLILICAGLSTQVSCTTTSPLYSKVRPKEVSDLQVVQPLSYISLIEDGNKGKTNDSLSKRSSQLLISIPHQIHEFPVTGNILVSDTNLRRRLENEVIALCTTVEKQKSISNLKITPLLDSLIQSKGKRFGLVTISSGYTRTKENYNDQSLKAGGEAILTLGMYSQVPVKARFTLYSIIVDAKADNIAFYKRTFVPNSEPLDEDVLRYQFEDIFKDYLREN